MITAGDRVGSVLAKDEGLLEIFLEASPAFEMLRDPLKRKTMARLVTIQQAARIAKIDVAVLLGKLNEAAGASESSASPTAAAPAASEEPEQQGRAPDGLLETPAEKITDLDVRPDLRAGREPLRIILDAVKALPAGNIFRLRATFEPVPLFAVLGRQGFSYFSEELAADDWRVWFFRDAAGAPKPSALTPPGAADEPAMEADAGMVVLDVRELEPPEPMMRTLEALAELPRGKTLLQINQRVPQFLLPKITERGFKYEIREQSADLVRIFISHA